MKRKQRQYIIGLGILLAILVAALLCVLFFLPNPDEINRISNPDSIQVESQEESETEEETGETTALETTKEADGDLTAEEESKAEESKKAEEESKAEESKKAEEESKAEESKKAEEESKAEESKKAEEESKAEESKKAEEESKAEESKKAEEESKAEESQKAEEESKAAESKKAEEESKAEESQTAESKTTATVSPTSKKAGSTVSKSTVEQSGINAWFTSSSISDSVFSRMKGKSYPSGCSISRDSLRYLKVLHYGRDGNIYVGELVCSVDIADSLLSVFKELYNKKYPIQKMYLVDEYGADDLASAAANNTSCFNYRVTAGTGTGLSKHAYGKAIDVNPLYNPYVWYDEGGTRHVDPSSGEAYADRESSFAYKLTASDTCVQVFKKYGFKWGGDWNWEKDYMHFYV